MNLIPSSCPEVDSWCRVCLYTGLYFHVVLHLFPYLSSIYYLHLAKMNNPAISNLMISLGAMQGK
jgi:hypothetical protein